MIVCFGSRVSVSLCCGVGASVSAPPPGDVVSAMVDVSCSGEDALPKTRDMAVDDAGARLKRQAARRASAPTRSSRSMARLDATDIHVIGGSNGWACFRSERNRSVSRSFRLEGESGYALLGYFTVAFMILAPSQVYRGSEEKRQAPTVKCGALGHHDGWVSIEFPHPRQGERVDSAEPSGERGSPGESRSGETSVASLGPSSGRRPALRLRPVPLLCRRRHHRLPTQLHHQLLV